LKEADLVVSFLTRDQGKLRGVAKRARRPKSTFGSGLERLSHVRMAYFQRESHELVNLDSCELIRSQFDLVTDYQASVALDFFAEASELLLPSAEPGERFFRLLVAVLESLRPAGGEDSGQAGRVWRAVTYFSFWAVRLSGWLPELHVCLGCGSLLDDPESPQQAFFSRDRAGLICGHCRRTLGAGSSWELSRESREIGLRIALGALRPQVVWMILRDSLLLVALGLPAALAGARAVESVLFGIQPADPFTFATTAALLAVIGAAAAFLLARRASRLDPSQVLRNE
jgi:DNA repair protein RecO (recombination protein O)